MVVIPVICHTSFVVSQDHEARVTGLVLLKNNVLASISFDRTIRLWDLSNMKPLTVVHNAHDTPIQCIEYARVGPLICCLFYVYSTSTKPHPVHRIRTGRPSYMLSSFMSTPRAQIPIQCMEYARVDPLICSLVCVLARRSTTSKYTTHVTRARLFFCVCLRGCVCVCVYNIHCIYAMAHVSL